MKTGHLGGPVDHPREQSKMTTKERLAKLRFDEETHIITLRMCVRHKMSKSA